MNFISAMVLLAASSVVIDQPVDYKTAYERAQKGDKPLLVLVTADWCPPCRSIKSQTLPVLKENNAFKEFHFAMVDVDKEPTVAKQLVGNRGVPQFVLFEKKDDGSWTRRHLGGFQTAQTVQNFIGKSVTIRTADAKPDKVEK